MEKKTSQVANEAAIELNIFNNGKAVFYLVNGMKKSIFFVRVNMGNKEV